MIVEGIRLMGIGMAAVFAFLGLLVQRTGRRLELWDLSLR